MMSELAVGADIAHGRTWVVRSRPRLALRRPAQVMGIINVTPDSFSDGGQCLDPAAAVAAGERMAAAGAAWLDVGGESSRPGAEPIPVAEELRRILPVIAGLRARGCRLPISVDTAKATVARAALDAGADAINDITAGADPGMFPLAAERSCPLALMHMRGTPATMQQAPRYDDVVDEVRAFLAGRMKAAAACGVSLEAMILDPGIGFGKTVAHNLELLRALPRLAAEFDRPLLVGLSRKSLIAALAGGNLPPHERDGASHVLHALIAPVCALLRVHDVAGACAACALAATDAGGRRA
jgi:dihydropteroate synthase